MTDCCSYGESTHTITLWDTRGEEGHDRLRPLSYSQTNVLLLCFSVASRESFGHITETWLPELAHYCPGVPYILVGTNADTGLDDNFKEDSSLVSINEIRKLARSTKWNGRDTLYVECDAREKADLEMLASEVCFASDRRLI